MAAGLLIILVTFVIGERFATPLPVQSLSERMVSRISFIIEHISAELSIEAVPVSFALSCAAFLFFVAVILRLKSQPLIQGKK